MRVGCGLVLFLLVAGGAAAAGAPARGASSATTREDPALREYRKRIKDSRKTLGNLRQDIRSKEAARERLHQEEIRLSSEYRKAEASARQAARELKALEQRLSSTENARRRTEARVRAAEAEEARWQTLLASDLRAFYELGGHRYFGGNLALWDVLAGEGYAREARRYAMVKSLARYKGFAYQQARGQAEVAAGLRADLVAQETRLVKLRAAAAVLENDRRRYQRQQSALLSSAQARRAATEEQLEALRESAAALEDLVKGLERRVADTEAARLAAREARAQMLGRRGNLPWPLQGDVTTHFGRQPHPDLNTLVISHGIRIRPATRPGEQAAGRPGTAGQTVTAVADGTVLYAERFTGYGRLVVLDHGGDFYTVYGDLSAVQVAAGDRVRAAQPVGQAGREVYFELRREGKPEDPLRWLR